MHFEIIIKWPKTVVGALLSMIHDVFSPLLTPVLQLLGQQVLFPTLATSANSDLLADKILQLRSVSQYPAVYSESTVLLFSCSPSYSTKTED